MDKSGFNRFLPWGLGSFLLLALGMGWMITEAMEGLGIVSLIASVWLFVIGIKKGKAQPSDIAKASEFSSSPVAANREKTIASMVSKGFSIDKEGPGYIQFSKPKGSVWGSVFLFLIGLLALMILPWIGFIILLFWFVSLFFVNRGKVVTVVVAESI